MGDFNATTNANAMTYKKFHLRRNVFKNPSIPSCIDL